MHQSRNEIAAFGGGCFWSLEVAFRNVHGVLDAAVGYEGGHIPAPTYQQVCSGRTGHAEVVQVTYDATIVPYEALVGVFFDHHDPTTRDRQGHDVGTQYRSAIFVRDERQRGAAQRIIQALDQARIYRWPIVTTIEPASTFWRAEEYHQQYLARQGRASCMI